MKTFDTKLIIAVVATAVALGSFTYHYATASHGFETGAIGGGLPTVANVMLAGQVMRPGDYLAIADFSPNYVSGHLLVRIPCDPTTKKPLVTPVAGHIDELLDRTWVAPAQLNLVPHASSGGIRGVTGTCVYHSHIPALDTAGVGNPGAPRVTDIGLLNQGQTNVVFRTSNSASFTLLRVVGDINPPNQYGPTGSMPAPYNAVTFPEVNLSNPQASISIDTASHSGH
jgi:hypothetical protein